MTGDTAGDSSGRVARFPRQPLPAEQSVLWRPAVQELARPDDEPSLIFLAQRALAAVEDHLVSAPHEALLGFLVGRVFETPETGTPYVIVHGAVRVPQMIVDGASERVVTQALAAAQRMLPPEDGVVVGWYRSDPAGVLKISPDDHAAHVRHFPRHWQVALLVTVRPGGTRGGCFRPAGDPGSPSPYLPFYELLDADSFRDGWKQPRVSWSNYWSPDPAVWRVRAEPARAPRVTPSERPSGASRFIPIVEPDDYDDPAWRLPRGPGRACCSWRWGSSPSRERSRCARPNWCASSPPRRAPRRTWWRYCAATASRSARPSAIGPICARRAPTTRCWAQSTSAWTPAPRLLRPPRPRSRRGA